MDVCSLGYAWIESTDPSRWLAFGTEVLGMMVAPGMPDDGNVYLKMDTRPYRFAVYKGETDRLACCGWEMRDKAHFHQACQLLEAQGVNFKHASAQQVQQRRVKEAICLQDPSGNTLELYWGAELDHGKFVSPVGVAGFETGLNGAMGFGHAVLPAVELTKTHKFYKDLLGFGDSDYMHFTFSDDGGDHGHGLYFMHVSNPRHHSLALYEDTDNQAGCVHLMVEVHSIDEVGYCLDRAQEHAVPIVSSLGRHCNDNMFSFYMATPAGFAMEFGCEGLQLQWDNFTPTVSTLPSLWGHKFNREILP